MSPPPMTLAMLVVDVLLPADPRRLLRSVLVPSSDIRPGDILGEVVPGVLSLDSCFEFLPYGICLARSVTCEHKVQVWYRYGTGMVP